MCAAKLWMTIAEWIRNARHRLAQVKRAVALAVRDIFGDLAQPVHVVDENNQAAWAAVCGA